MFVGLIVRVGLVALVFVADLVCILGLGFRLEFVRCVFNLVYVVSLVILFAWRVAGCFVLRSGL